MGLILYAHNQTAYLSVCSMLDQFGKAAVIHPTGTGKSFIAFKLIADHPGRSFLWLSPSEYIFKTQKETLYRESPEVSLDNVSFYTYARLAFLPEETFEGISAQKPDYIILDEYHRGGAPEWEKHLRRLLKACDGAKLLGLSATNIRYLDNRRDMAQELFDGYIASEMTLGEAIVKKILPAPRYVTALYEYEKEIERYQRRISRIPAALQSDAQRILDSLKRALENADGLERIFVKHITKKDARLIVFCASLEHMQLMQIEAEKWFQGIDPDYHSYCVYSDNPEAGSDFSDFKNDHSHHLKLLFCIDMLNEGIHVADLDGVVMLRPTVSPIVYKQQLGRALSAGSGGTPLVFDIVNNFDGLYGVDAIGDEMARTIRLFPNGEGSDIWAETGFTILDEVREARELFQHLDSVLSSGWEVSFSAAKQYYEEHGNLQVPRRYVTERGLPLGMWIVTQRRVYRGTIGGKLTDAQIARLESIGMVWDNRLELSWNKNYEEALNYYNREGHLKIPHTHVAESGVQLGIWICNQRIARKEGRLSKDQIARLDALGMVWNYADEKWESFYQEAMRYYKQEGHLRVPRAYVTPSGVRLGSWIAYNAKAVQGKQANAAPLTEDQIRRLEAIGMEWSNRNEDSWNRFYAQAKQYYEAKGTLDIPNNYIAPDGSKLGVWLHTQRRYRKNAKNKKNSLTPQRIALLDAIGMDWRLEDPWEQRYAMVLQYRDEHGHLQIPADYKTADGIWLGKWLYRQRVLLKKCGTLTAEQAEKIAALELTGNWNRS